MPIRRQAHRVAIALGSNIAPRIMHIETAIAHLRAHPALQLSAQDISPLYETKPMYYTDQASFINGAVEVSTDLPPLDLLDVLQGIEREMGRVKVIEKGPRPIDLDVILYGEETVREERLTVPHRLVGEREFVLRPLNEYVYPVVCGGMFVAMEYAELTAQCC
jgi:2-amino-4-hydroxy-6-hydroxymethyldihydropteridine diphosphokinase / dihydropteroate synthase